MNRPARSRSARAPRLAAVAVGCAALGACAPMGPAPNRLPWRVEPVVDVRHAMPSAEAEYLTGRYWDGSRRWEAAMAAYQRALAVQPDHVESLNALGADLARVGRLEEAEARLQQASAAAPGRADILSNLGLVRLMRHRPAEAVATLRQALEREPGNAVARGHLEVALEQVSPRPVAEPAAEADDKKMAADARGAPARVVMAAAQGPRPAPLTAPEEPGRLRLEAPTAATTATLVAPGQESPAAARPARSAAQTARYGAPALRLDDRPTLPAWWSGPREAPAAWPSDVEVSNGYGRTGAAARLLRWLAGQGAIGRLRATNQPAFDVLRTVVEYRPGHQAEAMALAAKLPVPALLREASRGPGVKLVIGADWEAVDAGWRHRS